MRAFIAVDFSVSLKKAISRFQRNIQLNAISGRWKHIDNFHLTLKFIGEINNVGADQIGKRLDSICSCIPHFKLEISRLGSFPALDDEKGKYTSSQSNRIIRVIWLGLAGDIDLLDDFQLKIEKDLQKYGFKKEGAAFRPHITIGQDVILEGDFCSLQDIFSGAEFEKIEVGHIILFRSDQLNGKRIYTPYSMHDLGA